jgi:hypothetical protein
VSGHRYWLGLDLGQLQDYSALAVLERLGPTAAVTERRYHARHLERLPLNTPYPAIVKRVGALLNTSPLRGCTELVVDATGVGRPVIDMLKQAQLRPMAVTITAGDAVTREGAEWHVPKRDLIGQLQVLLQTQRLVVADALPEAATLVRELLGYQMKITLAGHDTYGAWREGTHDDLVLALAIAAWAGEQARSRVLVSW